MKKYPRTTVFITNQEEWDWAKHRTKKIGFKSISDYLFFLIKLDKRGMIEETEIRANISDGTEITLEGETLKTTLGKDGSIVYTLESK